MRPKSLLLLILALGCGLVASVGITQVLDRSGGDGKPAVDTESIYVAKEDIDVGDKITEELVNLQDWPKDKIPYGSVRELEQLIDRHPRTKIYTGEAILDAKLLDKDARDNPAQQVPSGYRVVSVPVDDSTGCAGLLRPGDRVDVQVYVKRSSQTGIGVTKAKTILSEIRVFAVDQYFRRTASDEDTSPARTVSLVVTPDQADKLTLAAKLGEINLIIRNPDDQGEATAKTGGASVNDLFTTSHVDRKREKGPQASLPQTGGGLGSFLEQVSKVVAATRQAGTKVAAATPPWQMLVIEGSDTRVVEMTQADASTWHVQGTGEAAPGQGSGSGMPVPAIPASSTIDSTSAPAVDGPASSESGEGTADESLQDDIDELLGGPQVDDRGLPIFTGGESDD